MSLFERFPPVVLETILTHLAGLFLAGAGNDATAARHAAAQMLTAYQPLTAEELCLAASIICFSFQALEALAQAADPNLPITRTLRLRSGAVSLNREANKARNQLTQLQKARQQAQPVQPEPQPTPATTLAMPAKSPPSIQTEADRQQELRIAASLKRAEARVAACQNTATAPNAIPTNATAHHHQPIAHAV
jgi:hypothetical protein